MFSSLALLASRVLVAQLFLGAAAFKVFDPSATLRQMADHHLPLPLAALPAAIAIELGGGLALLLGVRTRLVAPTLAIYVAIATSIFHTGFGQPDQLDLFAKDWAVIGGLLTLMAAGPGRFSVDALLARRSSRRVCGALAREAGR